jgi:hypothetical protein
MLFAKDRYILFSLAAISMIILICAVGSFNSEGTTGNGYMEITGMISDTAETQNGTLFKMIDTDGNEIKCFSSSPVPDSSAIYRAIGNYSADGNIFFVDTFVSGR